MIYLKIMKRELLKYILIVLIFAFSWQHVAYASPHSFYSLRQVAFNQRDADPEYFIDINPRVFASLFDHTNLNVSATEADIKKTAQQARDGGYALVAVRPGEPSLWAAEVLNGSSVKAGPAIGFRLLTSKYDGRNMAQAEALARYDIPVEEKLKEIIGTITSLRAKYPGVGFEIDFVINVKRLLDGDTAYVENEIRTLIDVVRRLQKPGEHIIVKVIGENCFLSEGQKRFVYGTAKDAGADFVKTSTGFAHGGATAEDLRLMREIVGPDTGLKAAAGVRTAEDALKMIRAANPAAINSGRMRIGTSASLEIERGYRQLLAEHSQRELNKRLAKFGLPPMRMEAFVGRLDAPMAHRASDAVMGSLGWSPAYVSGVFTRNALESSGWPRPGYDYLAEDADPVIDKLTREISQALGVTPDDLHADDIKAIYRLVFNARDPGGHFLIGGLGEITFFRWTYRELFDLLLSHLNIPGVAPARLQAVLANPLQVANDTGNDQMRQLVRQLIDERTLTDDAAVLRSDPARIKEWFRYMLAANDIDYTKPAFLKKLQDPTFNLATHVRGMAGQAFVPELGQETYLDEFLARYVTSQDKKTIVVVADNNQELIFVLKTCEACLTANPNLTIRLVLKQDNKCLNDAAVQDGTRTLAVDEGTTNVYGRLRDYGQKGRFALVEGPPSQGLPLDRFSTDLAQTIRGSDAVVCVGEANFWSANGLTKETWFGLKLKWMPFAAMACGIKERSDKPPAFFRVNGEAYIGDITAGRVASFAAGEPSIPVASRCVRDVLTPPLRSAVDTPRASNSALSAI